MELKKVVFRHKLITKGKRVVGIEPKPCRIDYLPAGEEGEKCLEQFIHYLYGGFVEYLGREVSSWPKYCRSPDLVSGQK